MAKTKKTPKLGSGKTTPTKKPYSLEVVVNDTVYQRNAKNLSMALRDFVEGGDFPYGVKTRVVIRYKKGKVERQRLLHVPEARRVFNMISAKPSALELYADKLEAELA